MTSASVDSACRWWRSARKCRVRRRLAAGGRRIRTIGPRLERHRFSRFLPSTWLSRFRCETAPN